MLKRAHIIFAISMLLGSSFSVLGAAKKSLRLTVALNEITYEKYPEIVTDQFCNTFPNPPDVHIDRNLMEFYFVCLAAAEEGITLIVDFVPTPTYARAMQMVKHGEVDMLAQTAWGSDAKNPSLYMTVPVIQKGEFEKGIYTRPDHPIMQLDPAHIDLSNLIGLTSSTWKWDVIVLKSLTEKITYTTYIRPRFRMIEIGRADFTMLEFSSKQDLAYVQDGITMKPILGVKVVMPESRHFVLSTIPRGSEKLLRFLDSGLSKLRAQGKIRELYQASGMLNPQVANWRILNPVD